MMYVDEPFLEYCTPECLNPVETDAAARAGEWHLRRIASAHEYFTGAHLDFCVNRGRAASSRDSTRTTRSEMLFGKLFQPTGWPKDLDWTCLYPTWLHVRLLRMRSTQP